MKSTNLMLCDAVYVVGKLTDVSEEFNASIFRVEY
jgi:hypothetical protein